MDPAFFQNLRSFSDFEEVTEDRHYTPVPQDWCVVISDVTDSTGKIAQHQYRDVNTVGAATIVAVTNALDGLEIPYAFGGDGATLLVPGSYRDRVSKNLNSLRDIALRRFDLQLRIAIVDVSDLPGGEATIEVAKFELIAGKAVALFRGGGLALAEKIVKQDGAKYDIPQMPADAVDLSGLSCRWHEIPNKHGFILSLLVKARSDNAKQVYVELIAKLTSIFKGVLSDANPVNPSLMTYRSVGQSNRHEKRLEQGFFAWIKTRFEIVAAAIIFKLKLIPQWMFHSKAYLQAIRSHSDYRKFDDMFRMILDCSPEQVMELSEFLDAAHQRGDLWYGIHQSQTSLMTCYVQGLGDGEHIHFIDGGDGGYTMASKQLKAQIGEGAALD